MAPLGPVGRVHFDYTEWLTLMQYALATWTALSDTLPQDVISDVPNLAGNFRVEWKSQQDIFNETGHIYAATTGRAYEDPSYPCRITSTKMWFAWDPQTIQGSTAFWGTDGVGNCAPQCGTYDLDFLSAAVHEYGHALGLDHTLTVASTMYPRQTPNDSISRTLSACDIAIVKTIYRDNFGPAVIDSFVVNSSSGDTVVCRWRVRQESGCQRYMVKKSLEDGTTWVVADSVACVGAGWTHTAIDPAPAAGLSLYVLSVVDSLAPGVLQERALAEQSLSIAGPPGAMSARRIALEPIPGAEELGFGTPEDAVRALGIAVTSRDDSQYRRAKADGFMYFSVDNGGLFWGRAIDGILEDGLRACLATQDSTIDSLSFEPQSSEPVSDNLVRVTATAQYVHRCQSNSADWAGEIVAIVERRRLEDGWRVRQVTELR